MSDPNPNDQLTIDSSQLPLRVSSIQLEGIHHTNRKIPLTYLGVLNECRSLHQLNSAFKYAASHMISTGLYTDVQFAVLPPDENREFASDVRVHCAVKECSRPQFRIGVDQQLDQSTPSGHMSMELLDPINGFGEVLRVSLSKDAKGSVNGYSVALNKVQTDINSTFRYHAALERSQISRDWVAGFNTTSDRVVVGGTTNDGMNTLECELGLRNATPILDKPEHPIVASLYVPNFKAALRYARQEDTRDNASDPHTGNYYRLISELSGFVGDTSAFKLEGGFQHHHPLNPTSTLSLTIRGGFQQPWRNILHLLTKSQSTNPTLDFPDIPIHDRFFLGSMYTRGLSAADFAPKAGRHVFGADVYASATASVSTTIPNFEDVPIRPQVFLNVTQLASLSSILQRKYGATDSGLTEHAQLTSSIGAGLVFPLSFGRIEVNLASQIKTTGLTKPAVAFSVSSAMDW